MKTNNIPFFELDGKKYEIKRNRFLQAEFDELKRACGMTDEEEVAYTQEQELLAKVKKLMSRKEELYDKWLETFSDEDEAIYKKACSAYDDIMQKYGNNKSVIDQQNQRMINLGEQMIILSLQYDRDKKIREEKQAKELWERVVEENGQIFSMEFVVFTLNYIVGNDEESENPFVAQAKAKAEQKAQMKKGLKLVK